MENMNIVNISELNCLANTDNTEVKSKPEVSKINQSKIHTPRKVWGRLTRESGTEQTPAIPSTLNLKDEEIYIGRVPIVEGQGKKTSTHEKQLVIPCPFVSATHFCLKRIKLLEDEMASDQSNRSVRYIIKDFSRNGTYLNGTIIGTDNECEVMDNDKISFIFFGDVKIVYRFSVVHSSIDYEPSEETGLISNANSAFMNQLTALKEEKCKVEKRLSIAQSLVEELTKERDCLLRDHKSIVEDLGRKDEELNLYREHVKEMEVNQSVSAAQIRILSEELDDQKAHLSELKLKYSNVAQDVEYKAQLLAARESIVEDMNRTLLSEKSERLSVEKQCQQLEAENLQLESKNQELQKSIVRHNAEFKFLEERLVKYKDMNEKLTLDMNILNKSLKSKVDAVNSILAQQTLAAASILCDLDSQINATLEQNQMEYEMLTSSKFEPVPEAFETEAMTQDSKLINEFSASGKKNARFSDSPVSGEYANDLEDMDSQMPSKRNRADEKFIFDMAAVNVEGTQCDFAPQIKNIEESYASMTDNNTNTSQFEVSNFSSSDSQPNKISNSYPEDVSTQPRYFDYSTYDDHHQGSNSYTSQDDASQSESLSREDRAFINSEISFTASSSVE